jgi:hypothetical protein
MCLRIMCRVTMLSMLAVTMLSLLFPPPLWARPWGSGEGPGERRYREKSSGTFVNSPTDTNQDGIPATLSLVTGRSNMGRLTGHTLGELAPAIPTGACAANELELQFVSGVGIKYFTRGDVLVLAPTSSVLCAAADGTGVFVNQGIFQSHGSTGRFAGVPGTWETHGQVTGLVINPLGLAEIGTIAFTIEGTLILP